MKCFQMYVRDQIKLNTDNKQYKYIVDTHFLLIVC